MSSSDSSKKIVLSKQQLSKSLFSTSPNRPSQSPQFPALPITQNRFAPLTPNSKPRSFSSIIQNQPRTTQITPSTSIPSTSTKRPTTIPYTTNPNLKIIKILEPLEVEKVTQSFLTLIDFLFHKKCHFYNGEYKTREYYQTILVDSGSVIIKHNFNNNNKDPSRIDYSQVKIIKVLTLEDWNVKPYTSKTLSNFSSYPQYNYYDYQEAWYKTFLLRNYDHSWFFQFDDNFPNIYPRWFVNWYKYMGIVSEAFPKDVSIAFSKFTEYFQNDGTPIFEYLLQFMSVFRIPWILSWTYYYKEEQPTELSPPILYRQYRCKWWNKFDVTKANDQAVQRYYRELTLQYERSQKAPLSSPTIQLEDQEYIQRLQACTTPEQVQQILNEVRNSPSPSKKSNSPETEVFEDSQDPYDLM